MALFIDSRFNHHATAPDRDTADAARRAAEERRREAARRAQQEAARERLRQMQLEAQRQARQQAMHDAMREARQEAMREAANRLEADRAPVARLPTESEPPGRFSLFDRVVDSALTSPLVDLAERLMPEPESAFQMLESAVRNASTDLREAVLNQVVEHAPQLAASALNWAATHDQHDRALFDDLFRLSDSSPDLDLQAARGAFVATHPDRDALVDSELLSALAAGSTDDTLRAFAGGLFTALDVPASHTVMQRVRDEDALDAFLDLTLRDENGEAVHSTIRDAVAQLMEGGRLDAYAETLATVPITAHDPDESGRYGAHHFDPGENGVYLNTTFDEMVNGDTETVAAILAHELFHAYAHQHGSERGAVDEGWGIAAARHALTDEPYNVAEMVYGTMNFYRDINDDDNFPMGNFENADPELRQFIEQLAARDSSQISWDDPEQLEVDYEDFFADLDRDQPWEDWLVEVDRATTEMLGARE